MLKKSLKNRTFYVYGKIPSRSPAWREQNRKCKLDNKNMRLEPCLLNHDLCMKSNAAALLSWPSSE